MKDLPNNLPNWVKIDKNWVYIITDLFDLSGNKTKVLELAEVMKHLYEAGYEYYGITHTLGYYDSVENIKLEFRKKSK